MSKIRALLKSGQWVDLAEWNEADFAGADACGVLDNAGELLGTDTIWCFPDGTRACLREIVAMEPID